MMNQQIVTQVISVLRGESSRQAYYPSRVSTGLIFKLSGKSEYIFDRLDRRSLTLCDGQALLIPRGSAYHVQYITPGHYVSVNFELQPPPPSEPIRYNCAVRSETLLAKITQMEKSLCTPPHQHTIYRQFALMYGLLDILTQCAESSYVSKDTVLRLAPAEAYLQTHLFDPALRVARLSELCGMSDSYFRRIFLSVYRTTPSEYITQRRLHYAQQILESGEFVSIHNLAVSVGYEDPLYFSKCFRHMYGLSPTQYLHSASARVQKEPQTSFSR